MFKKPFSLVSYPFNFDDLTITVSVSFNQLENSIKVPWEHLRYLFGEIMYGGHITDDWDRRICKTYLVEYLKTKLVEGIYGNLQLYFQHIRYIKSIFKYNFFYKILSL